jgi:DNA-binding response OmpR family regulator
MKKILVADDEAYIRELLLTTLEVGDYNILVAKDGKEALMTARKEKPDLILLDIGMPKLDGFEVCKRLKSDPDTETITIVMLTALGLESEKAKGTEVGADDYFVKPFSPMALLDKIKEVFGE